MSERSGRILSEIMVAAILIGAFSYGGYSYYLLQGAFSESELTNTNLQYDIAQLSDKLKAADALNHDLVILVQARGQEKEAIGQQMQQLSMTVDTLNKLTNTDKELLEKYSSVFFLNENYIPKSLTTIDTSYLNRPASPEQFVATIVPHLNDLERAAASDGVHLQILSAYRSYGTQSTIKTIYKVTYGARTANAFSADQGYSEHQLGTTLDFTTPTIGAVLTGFDKTPEYAWLLAHAHLYGFNLSYPKNNTHFVFEPWHWRYVGVELAKKLHDEHKNLNDLDQRDIDAYLVKFFD